MANEWKNDANCRNMDTELFFPKMGGNIPDVVWEICSNCSVIEDCLWYANETHSTQGVFGGMSPSKRETWRSSNKIQLGESRKAA